MISLDGSIEYPQHCIELSSDHFVVSHGTHDSFLQRVCKVDSSGRIIQSYGRFEGSDVEILSNPRHLIVDKYGNVLVADSCNQRVVLLNSSLAHLGYIEVPENKLKKPYALYFDDLGHRLYIGENVSSGRVFVLDVYVPDLCL